MDTQKKLEIGGQRWKGSKYTVKVKLYMIVNADKDIIGTLMQEDESITHTEMVQWIQNAR